MAKKKEATEAVTKERAAVSRERRLAPALVGVLDALEGATIEKENDVDSITNATTAANALLNDLGYSNLESTAKTLTRINEHIKDAVAAGDGERLAELGKELQKAQSGKFRMTSTPPASDADDK